MPIGALDNWIAFDSVDPIGERWRQTSKILHAIWSGINLFSISHGGKGGTAFDEDGYMPATYKRVKKRERLRLLTGDACKRAFSALKSLCLLKK